MFNHLLIPLDGSPFAEAALPYAVSLATQYQCDLTMLRVINPAKISEGPLSFDAADLLVKMRDDLYRDAIAYCRQQQSALSSSGFPVHYQVVEADDVAQEISRVAEECGADTIIMSSHGRGGLSRWLFGSVAARVLQISAAPVLVVRPAELRNGGMPG